MRSLLGLLKKNRNSRYFLAYSMVNSLWFIEAIWYFYWGNFLSYTQVGITFAWLVVVGLVAEVPTGVFADKYGRKNSVLAGSIIIAVGSAIMTSSINGVMLILGTTISTIGRAFVSGALEALTYDSLKQDNLSDKYDSLVSFKFQLSLIAYIVAVPIGGYLYQLHFRLPNLLEFFSLVFAIAIATQLKEVVVAKQTEVTLTKPQELVIGFRELWTKSLRPYVLPSILIITTFELYDWGLSKPAMAINFGLDSKGQSVVYTLLAISNVVTVGMVPKMRKILGDYTGLRLLSIISGFAFVVSTLHLGLWGISSMWLIETSGNLGDPWTSSTINENVGSRYRATTISSLAFLTRIPHLLVNIMAGYYIDTSNINNFHLLLGSAIVILTCLTFYPIYRTKNS